MNELIDEGAKDDLSKDVKSIERFISSIIT